MADFGDAPSVNATWAALAARVGQELGLHFPPARSADLERGITAAARAFGQPDALACARWLLTVPWTRQHVDVLARCLAVGETYFFRDRAAFEALETQILPPLLEARAAVRRLRIWSAGCSTGEEPYSIAMLLERAIPDIEAWNVAILATDIDPQALAKAAHGVYGEWSFREMPPNAREACFSRDARGRWEIAPRLRRRVEWRCLNLVREPFPSIENGTNAMDVIFCRNVLMYFEPERARQVMGKLAHSLRDDGWLFVNPVEVPHVSLPGLVPVHLDGAIVHRKRDAFPAQVASTPAPPPEAPSTRYVPPTAPQIVMQPEPAPDPDALSRRARECANRGELEEARAWCERAVAADKLNAHSHYLLASVLQELRLADAAASALRRTLYLEPRHVLAHYALGHLSRRQGRVLESARHFRNALRAIDAWAPDEAAREFDGMDVMRLAEVIRASMAQGASA
jgi:chemotaxis protein methyltransferase CheR